MSKIVVTEFLTLDGVMQSPGSPDEDRSGGFDRGGWQLPYFDEEFGKAVMDGFAGAGGFLLGRRTYDIFAAYWPAQPADDPVAGPMNATPKFVVSSTLAESLAWQNSILIKDNVPAELAKLREREGKDLLVMGSGELVQTLMANKLVDEYRLMVHPIVLGIGKRLFRQGLDANRLNLVDSRATSTGVLLLTYKPADQG